MLKKLWHMRSAQWALGGGLLASLCCIGPPLAVLLGLSGASFLVGLTLYSPYFYALSFVLVAIGFIYSLRRQTAVCNFAEQRRNRWLLPIVMVGIMSGSYLLLAEVLTPAITPLASARLAPGDAAILDMPGMDHGGMAMEGDHASMEADVPVMFASATMAQPETVTPTGTIHRAEIFIDKMT